MHQEGGLHGLHCWEQHSHLAEDLTQNPIHNPAVRAPRATLDPAKLSAVLCSSSMQWQEGILAVHRADGWQSSEHEPLKPNTPSPNPLLSPLCAAASPRVPRAAPRRGFWTRGGTEQHRTICQRGEMHRQCLKTESCYFNYGLSALSPIAFLTHSSANLVINQSLVARSCSLAPSPSLPRSLRALAPLVCSPALLLCAFLIGFGLELPASRCPRHGLHTGSSDCRMVDVPAPGGAW